MAAWLLEARRIRCATAILLGGCFTFLIVGMTQVYGHHLTTEISHLLYGGASAAILVGALHLERTGRLYVPIFVSVVGDASYSIYLCHDMVLSALAKSLLLIKVGSILPLLLSYVAMVVIAVLVGVMFHLIVEAPMLARLTLRNCRQPPKSCSTTTARAWQEQ